MERRLQPGEVASLTTPGYPGDYPNGLFCPWKITTTTPGEQIHLSFSDFTLARGDYLYIGLENEIAPALNVTSREVVEILRYTGDQVPPDIISPGQTIYVTLETDGEHTGRGFGVATTSTSNSCK